MSAECRHFIKEHAKKALATTAATAVLASSLFGAARGDANSLKAAVRTVQNGSQASPYVIGKGWRGKGWYEAKGEGRQEILIDTEGTYNSIKKGLSEKTPTFTGQNPLLRDGSQAEPYTMKKGWESKGWYEIEGKGRQEIFIDAEDTYSRIKKGLSEKIHTFAAPEQQPFIAKAYADMKVDPMPKITEKNVETWKLITKEEKGVMDEANDLAFCISWQLGPQRPRYITVSNPSDPFHPYTYPGPNYQFKIRIYKDGMPVGYGGHGWDVKTQGWKDMHFTNSTFSGLAYRVVQIIAETMKEMDALADQHLPIEKLKKTLDEKLEKMKSDMFNTVIEAADGKWTLEGIKHTMNMPESLDITGGGPGGRLIYNPVVYSLEISNDNYFHMNGGPIWPLPDFVFNTIQAAYPTTLQQVKAEKIWVHATQELLEISLKYPFMIKGIKGDPLKNETDDILNRANSELNTVAERNIQLGYGNGSGRSLGIDTSTFIYAFNTLYVDNIRFTLHYHFIHNPSSNKPMETFDRTSYSYKSEEIVDSKYDFRQ